MYLNILKKDLKRKKTMNLILLVFIILASMFVSSSANNIIAVTTALDGFLEKAGAPDYLAASMNKGGGADVMQTLDKIEAIDSYGTERILFCSDSNSFSFNGENLPLESTLFLTSFGDAQQKYFDEKNNVIEEVEPGTVWIVNKFMLKNNMKPGDTLKIKFGDVSGSFKIAGGLKDACLGADMMGMTRFFLNEKDFEKFASDKKVSDLNGGHLIYIKTDDIPAVEKELNRTTDILFVFNDDVNLIKKTYIMDTIIAGILLILSVCLIVIAFVMLQFTISFTLSEEFREIGVMKAIGVSNMKIRGLYILKYLVLAVFGSLIGFFLSIPFGNMLLESVSASIVMGSENSILVNIVCSLAVVAVILLFCLFCTRKVKRFTPIDAIRNGTTGERFTKKGCLHLEKTPLKPSGFMALNDVLSNPKRFSIVILVFMLSLSLVLVFVNTINTLRSDSLAQVFGLSKCDVIMESAAFNNKLDSFITENGREEVEKTVADVEKKLAENGIPGDCSCEIMMKLTLSHGENICKSIVLLGVNSTADQYEYIEGTPPQRANEAALTQITAQELGASIGDTITLHQLEGEKKYLITALYQSMNNMGEGIRLHEDADISFLQASGVWAFPIKFCDTPDKAEVLRRIDKIRDIYNTEYVYTPGEASDKISGVSGTLQGINTLVLILISLIIFLITLLMERSFIAKEHGEIAILKAIGFKDGAIIKWHTLRFVISAVAAVALALIFMLPLTELSVGPIFKMMGADYGVKYEIVPIEVYIIYPLYILALTLISAFFAACGIRKINASESSNIE